MPPSLTYQSVQLAVLAIPLLAKFLFINLLICHKVALYIHCTEYKNQREFHPLSYVWLGPPTIVHLHRDENFTNTSLESNSQCLDRPKQFQEVNESTV